MVEHPLSEREVVGSDPTGGLFLLSYLFLSAGQLTALQVVRVALAVLATAPFKAGDLRQRHHGNACARDSGLHPEDIQQHQWSSGRIHRCHRCDPGSIPYILCASISHLGCPAMAGSPTSAAPAQAETVCPSGLRTGLRLHWRKLRGLTSHRCHLSDESLV
jgi:hypothetical protein